MLFSAALNKGWGAHKDVTKLCRSTRLYDKQANTNSIGKQMPYVLRGFDI